MTLLSILIRQLKNNLESIFTLPLLLEQKKAPRGVIFYPCPGKFFSLSRDISYYRFFIHFFPAGVIVKI